MELELKSLSHLFIWSVVAVQCWSVWFVLPLTYYKRTKICKHGVIWTDRSLLDWTIIVMSSRIIRATWTCGESNSYLQHFTACSFIFSHEDMIDYENE